MAVFSLTGLLLLTVAGPGVEARMTQRMRNNQAALKQAIENSASRGSDPVANSGSAATYSLDLLRGVLGIAAVCGIGWSLWSLRPEPESSGQ